MIFSVLLFLLILKSHHGLPVNVRSTYKMACLCYHCDSSTISGCTMECSQPDAWTTNRSLFVAFHVKACPGRPINSGSTLPRAAYLDGGVISVSPHNWEMFLHLPTCVQPPGFVPHAYHPSLALLPLPTSP